MTKRYLPGLAALLALALTSTPAAAQAPAWQWADSPGLGQEVHSATDAAGNLYLTGHFSDTLQLGTIPLMPPGGARQGQFIARRSAAGTYTWGLALSDSITIMAVAVDAQGDAYLTGGYMGRAAVFGATRLVSDGGAIQLFVAKLTAAGQWAWATSSGTTTAREIGQSLAVDGSGNVVVAGCFLTPTFLVGTTTLVNSSMIPGFQGVDMFVARLSPAGAWQWAASADGPGVEYATSVATDRAGRVVVGGYYYDAAPTFGATPMPAGNGLFVARLTPTGRWDRATGAVGNQGAALFSLALDAEGNTYAGGNFMGSLTLGSTTLYADSSLIAPSYSDMVVAKLDTAGRWQWAARAGGYQGEFIRRVALAPGGQVLVAGYFAGGTIRFGPDTLTNQSIYPGPGWPGGTAEIPDGFVACLSSGGAWQWGIGLNGTGYDTVEDLTVDGAGTVRVVGSFTSDTLTMGGTTVLNPASGGYRMFVAQLHVATPTGLVAEARGAGLALYPNPARRAVRLTGATGPTAVILDALGRAVRTQALGAEGAATLDLTGLPAGLYVVRCGGTAQRLVVE